MSSKEVKSNNVRTWNDVPVQLAHNPQARVIQVVSAPIATQMASRRVYPMTGIGVEDNAVVNNVVEVLYEVAAPKTGRSNTLNGLATPLRCTPPMSNKPTMGFDIACAPVETLPIQLGSEKNLQQGNGEAVWHAKKGSRTLTYATRSLLLVLLPNPHLCHT